MFLASILWTIHTRNQSASGLTDFRIFFVPSHDYPKPATTSNGTADHAHCGRAKIAVVMKTDNTPTSPLEGMADSKDAKHAACAFASLPDEIIELILSTCDPSSFASLVLLNRNWRRVSQQAQLYAQQLSRCRSYTTSHPAIALPVDDDELPKLRKAFAHEVKRNLYEAYLRPQETIIKLVSTSIISSSAALPGGEAFHFAFSSNGQYVLAYSTSRIHVLRFEGQELTVERELKILRRPASITILDDGSMLAVLSIDHQVDLYDLSNGKPKHIRAIALDHHPRTISLSPGGSVLAAAYDGGIEVYSLSATLATDKRGVKSDAADSLSFSRDGMQLLGTTIHSKNLNTVILTAPYFNPGEYSPEDSIGQLWATSILFPNSSRDCSHAVLLPSATDCGANWTFTYDRAFETFRAVRIDDLRNGTTYFTGPVADAHSSSKLLPSTLPATTGSGDLVSAGFQGKEIWCYGVPEDLDAPPESTAEADSAEFGTPLSHKSSLSGNGQRGSTPVPKDANGNKVPKWQELSNRSRNTFIEGRHVSSLDGIVALKWVATKAGSPCERLVAAAPGGVGDAQGHAFDLNEDGIAPMDGGRLLLLDFDYSIVNGEKRTITIEVGEKEPEVLEEEHRDMETEVAIVRRRTVAQSRGNHPAVLRSTTIAARPERGPVFTLPRRLDGVPMSALRRSSITKEALSPTDETSETASMTSIDDQEALDAPYAHGTPRSVATLRRAATAAAINRVLHPPRFGATPGPPRMRPADGHNEVPHESDADNWVPPPPPYSKDDIPTLPEHLRNAIQVGVTGVPSGLHRSSTQRSSASTESNTVSSLRRSRTTYVPMSRSSESPVSPHLSFTSPVSPPLAAAIPRPSSSSSAISASSNVNRESQSFQTPGNADDFDDMYDVSPQRTPEPPAAVPVAPVAPAPTNTIPRRPVGQPVVAIPESPVMSAPSVEPVSPIPRRTIPIPTVPDISVTPDQLDGNAGNSSNYIPPTEERTALVEQPASTDGTQVQYATVPPPQGSQFSGLPSMSPITPLNLHYPPSQDPPSRSDISPDANSGVPAPPAELTPADVNLPSTSLLERLNSRAQRPNSQQIGAQPRAASGSFQQAPAIHPVLPVHQNPYPYPESPGQVNVRPIQYNQTSYTDFGPPPRAATGAYNAQTTMSPIYPPPSHEQGNLGAYHSPYGDQQPFSPGGLRPHMARLETIYSVGSNGSAPAHTPTWPIAAGVSRRASRAERSAAINMQQAKQKGWRGTMKRKKKKKKDLDTMSSAGWTDVTTASYASEPARREKGGKCEIM
ncbi:hypothetical protein O988_07696 [Pseudogymnoascus sp. VKM F-3808]|nr:hypothetical protein O988_07696 [Pseudogymnoascus sp. VKM F-3808]